LKQQDSYSLNTLSTSLAVALATPVLFLSPHASAQSSPPVATEMAPVQVQGDSLYDVPVSSQTKFTAPLLDTPKTVQIIPQTVIQDSAATSLQDVLRNSPGITFGAGEGGQPLADRPFIRGSSSGNSIFVDGIRDPGGQTREIFNVESVEVIRGSDSVYGGRGSGGGSINLVSKKARLGSFVQADAGVGSDGYWRGTADGNWQFNGNSAFRLNVLDAKGNVPGRNVVDYDKWGVAPSLAFGLGTPTRVTLSYYHFQSDGMPDYGVPLASKIPGMHTSDGILDVGRSKFYGVLDRDYQKNKADIGTVELEHDFNDHVTLRNATRWGQTLNDYVLTNPGDGGAARFDPVTNEWWMQRGLKSRWNQTTLLSNVTELYGKFETGSLKHSYDVGVEFTSERNKNASYNVTTTSGSSCPGVYPAGTMDCTLVYHPDPHDNWSGTIDRGPLTTDTTSNTRAIYAFDTVELSERWQLNLGGRFDNYRIDGDFTPRGATAPQSTDGSWNIWSYQTGIVYKPAPNGSIYLSYATASTPPTVSGGDQESLSADTSELDPEKSSTIELGTKWNVLDEKLTLTAAVYQVERKDAQIEVDDGVFEQAGKTRVRGLELGFAGAVTRKWNVFGGYTYMDSELVKGAYDGVNEGDPLANTPRNSFSLWNTYKLLPKLTVGGGIYYVGKTFGGNQGGAGGGANGVYMPAYWRFDAMAAYQASPHLSFQLNVLNLTDKEYFTRTNGVHHADYGPGRQVILTTSIRY
jgi:catecholate siderophore receptor